MPRKPPSAGGPYRDDAGARRAGTALGDTAAGTVDGDFAARFDAVGVQRLPVGTSGTIMQG